MNIITHEKILELLEYDKDTGEFVWKERLNDFTGFNKKFAGKKAGAIDDYGYRLITICYKKMKAHILAWFITYKEFPKNIIDHIDRNKLNNRIENLREVSRKENSTNKEQKLPKSGFEWIYSSKKRWKFVYKTVHICSAKTIEEIVGIRDEFIAKLNSDEKEYYDNAKKKKRKRFNFNSYEKRKIALTHDFLTNELTYEKETGIWRRRKKSNKIVYGTISLPGYQVISVNEKNYQAHNLAWLYETGNWIKANHVIDHINGNRSDNRFLNLREVTLSQNSMNKKTTNEYCGVRQDTTGKWFYRVAIDKKKYYKSGFFSKEEAAEAKNILILEHNFQDYVPRLVGEK